MSILVFGGLALLIATNPLEKGANSSTDQQTTVNQVPSNTSTQLATGKYELYSTSLIGDANYKETILFFHASWCPECRAFEQAIQQGTIPEGVQILKVDYDNSSELKSQYGVTLQSTFVRINEKGEEVSQWVGYGKEKSIKLILDNT